MDKDIGKNVITKVWGAILGSDPRKRFIKFICLLLAGWMASYFLLHGRDIFGPETFKDYVLSLGVIGPVVYISIFIVRPFILIPSLILFIAGGLAFGPLWGPIYASLGAAIGGILAFAVARFMGQEYVSGKLKWKSCFIRNRQYSFSIVFLLSLFPIMPVAAINYGAGLSNMKPWNYFSAHFLGLTPRIFAYGFFGSALLDIGSIEFGAAVSLLIVIAVLTAFFHWRFRSPPVATDESVIPGINSG